MGEPTPLALVNEAVQNLRTDIHDEMQDLREDMTRRFDEQAKEIAEVKVQTTETNGSVRRLQLWKAHMEGMRAANAWLLPIVTSLVSGGGITLILLLTHHL